MTRILVLYHSQQFGHLHMMAEAFAEGIQEAGAEPTLFNASRSRFNIEDYRRYDAIAIGSPDYFSYVAGTLKTFLDDWFLAKSRNPEGLLQKPYALFLSYDGVGRARQALEMLFSRLGSQVGGIVECNGEPDEIILTACKDLGAKLAQETTHPSTKSTL